jgi:hypothetical protein
MHHPVSIEGHQILLWHQRLGHPSFGYMKHLFHELFVNMSDSNLKCDTCIIVTHQCFTVDCTVQSTVKHYDLFIYFLFFFTLCL